MSVLGASPTRRLLDTSILVHYARGSRLGAWVEQTYSLQTSPVVPLICVVTEGELRSLALQFGWGDARTRRLLRLISYFVSVPLDVAGIFDSYAAIDHFSRSTGRPMGKNDVWIAAAARVTGARLLTTDADFDHLDARFLARDYIDPGQFGPASP